MIVTPEDWPTQKAEPAFWEELGRAVATFGFLEDQIPRFLLALEGSRDAKEYTEDEVEKWVGSLERSLSDPLGPLVRRVKRAVERDARIAEENGVEFIGRLQKLSEWRNALCHGAWVRFDRSGRAQLRHFSRRGKKEVMQLCNELSKEDIAAIRSETVSVTHWLVQEIASIGVRFPGSELPGTDLRE